MNLMNGCQLVKSFSIKILYIANFKNHTCNAFATRLKITYTNLVHAAQKLSTSTLITQ